ncbi:hypothetical protein Daus18300_007025 [Diaporthe australafricana]|uniref:Uncharacterized protein n=1 Tax=Diaporthe australafricana TaxID=127596 RepID=A0ABR3WQU8_9PEZI
MEKLCGFTRHNRSSGGVMEIRDSGMALTVATRSPNELSSDYIRGMVTIVNFAFFDSLMLPMFISLPHMGADSGNNSGSRGIMMMLFLVVITSFILNLFLCRQVAFYRFLLMLSLYYMWPVELALTNQGPSMKWNGRAFESETIAGMN